MSGIVIGAVALLSIAWIGTVLYIRRLTKEAKGQEQWLAVVSRLQYNAEKRLDKVEQWERWIVKLQTQIKELQKAGPGPHIHSCLVRRVDEFERVAANMATVVKYLVPLAQAIHAGTEVATEQATKAYSPQKREALEPTWEELTSRPAQPFATTGFSFTGTR